MDYTLAMKIWIVIGLCLPICYALTYKQIPDRILLASKTKPLVALFVVSFIALGAFIYNQGPFPP